MRRLTVKIVIALLAFAVIGTAVADALTRPHNASLKVTLREMRIVLPSTTMTAGAVTFQVRNVGTVEHEMVILRRDSSTKLPVKEFKAAEDERAFVGEADEIAPGKSKSVTLTLAKGKYLLLCNQPGHYQLGMYTTLIVR